MATPPPRRYEPAELLFLAKSPLVKKPTGLPPIEEWMGPAPTRPTTSRARTEGDILGNGNGADDTPRGPMNRRPSIFSESRMSRSSINEDIVLGPPKMSFASSSARTSSGKFDHDSPRPVSLTSPAFEDDRGDSPQFQRFKGYGGGFGRGEDKDREPGSRDFSDLRGGFSKRRDDSEGSGWTNVSRQPRKSFGADDGGDRERFRKELRGEGEKKGTPWDRDRPAKYENFGKERERGERDRDHRGRGKRDESSWLLDDNRGERTRDNHREHNRFGGRVEKDPEWMDSDGKSGNGKAAHSMADFQKWKERMKASAAAAENPKKTPEEPAEKEPELEPEPDFQPESRSPVERFVEEKPHAQDAPVRQTNSPGEDMDAGVSLGRDVDRDRDHHTRHIPQSHQVEHDSEPQQSTENGVDRFFGFWSGNTILKSPEQGDILSGPRTEPRVGKSRFTSFFGPQESQSPPLPLQLKEQHHMPVNRTPPYTQSPTHETANEDREGFQRILKMLGGTNLNGSDSNPLPTTGLLSRPPQSNTAPATMTAHQPPPQSQHNLHHLSSPPARDSNTDFFMRLMRGEQQQQQAQQQAQQQQQQQQQQQHAPAPMHNKYGGPSQMPPPPPIDTSILHFNRGNHTISPSLEDPTVAMFRHRPNQESAPVHSHSRGPHIMDHHGPPPGWNPQPSQAPPPQSLRQVAPPPGFTRAQHQQGPPPPPPFLPPPGVNGPPVPFQLLNGLNGPLPPNMPPPPHLFMGGMNGMGGINGMNGMNGGPPPLPGSNMNGPSPQGGFPMQFPPHHHPDPMLGAIHGGPPFGFPHHDGLKSPPFSHGPPNKGIMR